MKQLLFALSVGLASLTATAAPLARTAALSGKVTDAVDGKPVVGASIYFPALKEGTVTDGQGDYTLSSLPAIKTTVQVSFLGHQTIVQTIDLRTTTRLDFQLRENNAMLGEVVVTGLTGQSLAARSPSPVTVVGPRQLQQAPATNIVDAIAHEPGMAQITTGGGIAKPVVRGLGYNRLVVVNDGIRQEGQQWGDEHGIEVDAQTVHSVEILKGPASLMYGSDAMAGVLIFNDEPVMPQGQTKATAATEYQTNNGLAAYSLDWAGNRQGVVWNWRWSQKAAHAYKNKADGRVGGSQFAERALTGMTGLNRQWGYSHLKLSAYHLTPCLIEGERDEETGLLTDQRCTYRKTAPFQQVRHYKVVSENSLLLGDGSLKATVGYQQNRRQEYEEADEAELDFRLHTVNYSLSYLSPESLGWKFAAGLSGMWQRSENLGEEYLIPAYRLLDVGAFASASKSLERLALSGGLRLDRRHLHSLALVEDGEARFDDFSRNFNGLTGSLGAIYNLSSRLNLKLNLSRGFRAPNMSELGSNGEHEGTFRYEVGNHALKAEHSWQLDLGADYSSHIASAQLSLFANHIGNYIFLQKSGQVYRFTQGDARLWGGEATLDIHPLEPLHFENTLSLVNAVQLHQPRESRYLPFTPAPRWTSNLSYDLVRDGHRLLNNTYIAVGIEQYFRQNHFLAANGTETATPAYLLVNCSAGTDIQVKGRKVVSIYLTGTNLGNRAYQSHLSRLKYADVNPKTGKQGVYNMGRNLGLKVIVPVRL